MKEIELIVPAKIDFIIAEQVIEQCCAAEGLTQSLKGSLKKYPGSRHWHFKQNQQRGVLEITLGSEADRLWFKVQAGRQASWIEEVILVLPAKIERELAKAAFGGEISTPQDRE